jgi:polygalacturonase
MKNILFALCINFLNFHLLIAKSYIITDYGAERNKIATLSIQKAIDDCFLNGGGKVVVPAGVFVCGAIVMKSNVHLYLESGAILKGSSQLVDYYVDGIKRGMIYAENAENIGLFGEGTIDADGDQFYDFSKSHVYDEFEKAKTRQKNQYMPEGTYFSDGPVKRTNSPGMTLVFFHCSHVLMKGITIKNTPLWATRFGYCDGVLIEGITILNNLMVPNSDGIHCTTSRNIVISNCNITAGDDAIVLTGFAKDEEKLGFDMHEQAKYEFGNKSIYAENMTVSNCILKSRSSGIRIGYGQHPIRRCIFSNIVIHDSHRGVGIFAHDDSNIEELIFSNITIETRLFNGQWWGHGEPIHLSCISRFANRVAGTIKNVQFNHIICNGEQGIVVYGQQESIMENIVFNQVQLKIKKGVETMNYGGNFDFRPVAIKSLQIFEHDIPGLYAQYVKNLSIQDFKLEWASEVPAFFTHGIECVGVSGLRIDNFDGSGNPNCKKAKKVKFENCYFKK